MIYTESVIACCGATIYGAAAPIHATILQFMKQCFNSSLLATILLSNRCKINNISKKTQKNKINVDISKICDIIILYNYERKPNLAKK